MATDKEKALQTALANIEKQFGKGAVMRLGENVTMNVDSISTGSLSLDLALGIGGLPKGRIVEIYGPESSGKTTLALHVAAEAQKAGGNAVKRLVELLIDVRLVLPLFLESLHLELACLQGFLVNHPLEVILKYKIR